MAIFFRPPPHPSDFEGQRAFYHRHHHAPPVVIAPPVLFPPWRRRRHRRHRRHHHHHHPHDPYYARIGPAGAQDLGFVGESPLSSASGYPSSEGLTREDEDDVLFGSDSGSSSGSESEEERMQDRAVAQETMRRAELSGAKVESMITEYEQWEELVDLPKDGMPPGSVEDARPFAKIGRAGNFLFFAKANPHRPTDVGTVSHSLKRLVEAGAVTLAQIRAYETAFIDFQRRDMPMKKALLDAYLRRYFRVEPNDRLPSALDQILAAIVINTKFFLTLLRSHAERLKKEPTLRMAPKMAAITDVSVARAKEAVLLESTPSSSPLRAQKRITSDGGLRVKIREPNLSLWEDAFEGRTPWPVSPLYLLELPKVLDNDANFLYLYRSRPQYLTTEAELYENMERWLREDEFLILDPTVIQDFLQYVAEAKMERNPAEPILRYLKRHYLLDAESLAYITPDYVAKLWANTDAVVNRLRNYLAIQLERLAALKKPEPGRQRRAPASQSHYERFASGPTFRDLFEADWEMLDQSSVGGQHNGQSTGRPLPGSLDGGNFLFLYRGMPDRALSKDALLEMLEESAAAPTIVEIDYFLGQFNATVRGSPSRHIMLYLKQHFEMEGTIVDVDYLNAIWANTLEMIALLQALRARLMRQEVRGDGPTRSASAIASAKKTRPLVIPLYERLTGLGIISPSSGPVPASSSSSRMHSAGALRSGARLEVTIIAYDSWVEIVEPLSFSMPRQSDLAPAADMNRHLDPARSFFFALKATPALLSGRDTLFSALARLDAQRKLTGEAVRAYIQDLAVFLNVADAYTVSSSPETLTAIRASLKELKANVYSERAINTLHKYVGRHYSLEAATDEELFAIEWRDLSSLFWRNTEEFFEKLLEYYEPRMRFMPTGEGDTDDEGDAFVDAPEMVMSSNSNFGSMMMMSAAAYRLKDEAVLNIFLSDQRTRLTHADNIPADDSQWASHGRSEARTYVTYQPKRGFSKRLREGFSKLRPGSVRLEPYTILLPTFYDKGYAPMWYGMGGFGTLPSHVQERLPRLPKIGRHAEGRLITEKLRDLRDMFGPLINVNDLDIIPAFDANGHQDRFIWVARKTVY